MSSEQNNQEKIPQEFKKLAKSFHGSTAGNIHSPIWFCGLEWGGGHDPKIPILWDRIQPYNFEALHTLTVKSFKDSFWAPRSQFCQNVIKLLVGLQKGHYDDSNNNTTGFVYRKSEDKDWYEQWFEYLGKRRIVGPNGLALILNMLPISVANRSVSNDSWQKYTVRKNDGSIEKFTDWTGLKNFYEYENEVVRLRSEVYKETREKYNPKLIVCFGKNSADNFKTLWGVKSKLTDVDVALEKGKTISYQYAWLNTGKTLFVIAPFPANPGGINSDEKINKISSSIVGLCKERQGVNWLGDYAQRNPDHVTLQPDSQLVKQYAELYKLKDEIDLYKEGMNKVCTQLENIMETLQSLSGVAEPSDDWSLFDKRVDEMRINILNLLKKLDDMKDKAEEQIKEVDEKL